MSTNLFLRSCWRCGLSIAFVVFGSLVTGAAEKDQLQAPTHRQVRVIEPKVDGKTLKLHTIATTADGHVLAAVGGRSMQYRHGRTQGNFGKRDRTSRAGFGSCCNPMNSLSMSDGTVLTAESSIGHIKRFDTRR